MWLIFLFNTSFSCGAPVEVSGPGGPNAPGVTLGERDVCVGWVYGLPSVCVLRHPASPSVTAALDVYTQNKYSRPLFSADLVPADLNL